jgi:diaminohydroxyphosphoribosylaminopyrimidine deaminase/5-amino-6-(5-phosphoribosylamino)uracil reductase
MARKTTEDSQWMSIAADLAELGTARTSPNPPVGAVIVKNGRQISTGWHRKAGGDHAEVLAIKKACKKATGASLYVTLEPCSTTGRTGPCVEAIIAAGINSVIVGSTDPNASHKGRGYRILRNAGIQVKSGVLRKRTDELIAPFSKWITSGTPFITLKMAMSLDGKIADAKGKSQWISCERSRKAVRVFRGKVDAVMVGAGTVLADNPSLHPIGAGKFQPYRIAVDTHGRTPLKSHLLTDGFSEKTIIVVGSSCPNRSIDRIAEKGATVLRVRESGGRVALSAMLKQLGKLNIMHILCEGGAVLAGSLLKQNIPDRYHIYSAPMILGSGACLPVVSGQAWTLQSAPRLKVKSSEKIGCDQFVEYCAVRR